MIHALLKHRWSFCIATAGFLSGSAILYLFASWPLFHFVKPGRKGEFYINVDDMAAFFINNRDDFEYLESYFMRTGSGSLRFINTRASGTEGI